MVPPPRCTGSSHPSGSACRAPSDTSPGGRPGRSQVSTSSSLRCSPSGDPTALAHLHRFPLLPRRGSVVPRPPGLLGPLALGTSLVAPAMVVAVTTEEGRLEWLRRHGHGGRRGRTRRLQDVCHILI